MCAYICECVSTCVCVNIVCVNNVRIYVSVCACVQARRALTVTNREPLISQSLTVFNVTFHYFHTWKKKSFFYMPKVPKHLCLAPGEIIYAESN